MYWKSKSFFFSALSTLIVKNSFLQPENKIPGGEEKSLKSVFSLKILFWILTSQKLFKKMVCR